MQYTSRALVLSLLAVAVALTGGATPALALACGAPVIASEPSSAGCCCCGTACPTDGSCCGMANDAPTRPEPVREHAPGAPAVAPLLAWIPSSVLILDSHPTAATCDDDAGFATSAARCARHLRLSVLRD